jgi:predicted transcriptional regulator
MNNEKSAKKKRIAGPGRPKLNISTDVVGQMALEGAKNTDIADKLNCDEATIRKVFSEILRKKRAERRMNLRKKQYDLAMRGNVPILIWLGKQELDQYEPKQQVEHSGQIKTNDRLLVEVVHTKGTEIPDDNGGNGDKGK